MKKNLFFTLFLALLTSGLLKSQDTPDWYNLQWPPTSTINQGQNTENIYARVYENGVTQLAAASPSISAWIGYGPINTNPNTWTNWTPATFNVQVGNDDEYMASIGSGATAGTYHYASRFQLNGGAYVYGGLSGPWAAPSDSGLLTVNAVLAVSDALKKSWESYYTDGQIIINSVINISSVELYDLKGALVTEKKLLNASSVQFNFSGRGIYLLKITTGDGQVLVNKIKI